MLKVIKILHWIIYINFLVAFSIEIHVRILTEGMIFILFLVKLALVIILLPINWGRSKQASRVH